MCSQARFFDFAGCARFAQNGMGDRLLESMMSLRAIRAEQSAEQGVESSGLQA